MYKIQKGMLKSDNTIVTQEEAQKFNEELPDFFSEEYVRDQKIKYKNMLGAGFLLSGVMLGAAG